MTQEFRDFKIRVFHNQTRGSRFEKYDPEAEMLLVWEGGVHAPSVSDALENTYIQHNRGDRPLRNVIRSLSAGDVIEVDGEWSAVEDIGFRSVPAREDYSILVRYPECEKLQEFMDERQTIHSFLEWMEQDRLVPCRWHARTTNGEPRSIAPDTWDEAAEGPCPDEAKVPNPKFEETAPTGYYRDTESQDRLIYRYLGIDPAKLEEEREAILAAARREEENRARATADKVGG